MIKENKKMQLITKIITFVLLAIFTVRLGIYQTGITSHIGLDSNNIGSKALTAICLILIWLENACIIMILSRRWFNFKTLRNIVKFVTPLVFILNASFVMPITKLLVNPSWGSSHPGNVTALIVFYILEAIIALGLSIYYFVIDFKEKTSYKEILYMIGMFLLMLIPALPTYFAQYMFGLAKSAILIKDITVYHRILIYLGFIIPICLYFALRHQKEDVIRFSLTYISVTTMIGFIVYYNYQTLATPWNWPIHLCNTAMFIIPLCLIFKLNRLFYFTYFINVFGAFCAMLMPNYSDSTNILSDRTFQFWFNHWIAFFMPVLIVSLNIFKRPKLREFKWSMIWFFGYFVIALVCNVVFTAMGHDVDYFFLNTNFVADKFGDWANKIFNIAAEVHVGGLTLTFHPIYQFLFFLCYVILGLGMWFVYVEFYRIGDSHIALHNKLKKIKQDEIAMKSKLTEEMKEELMNNNNPASFTLDHFSKRYASSKTYSVTDACLEVHAGEIFGFLGPNGAGKSTIIKSTVGIQTITDGHINICGYDVATDPVLSKYNIGYVPDHYALYEKLTGREYINYIADIYEVPQDLRNERIEKYIHLFELEASIDNKIKTYSHGMKQKITIMAALVHNPKVWILDEPLTGLDPNSIYQVKECMRQHAAEGNIVFFSSHIIDIVEKLCGRIAIIKKGQIQCVKTVKEIEDSGESLEEFYLRIINGDNAKDYLDKKDEVVNE